MMNKIETNKKLNYYMFKNNIKVFKTFILYLYHKISDISDLFNIFGIYLDLSDITRFIYGKNPDFSI